MSGSVVCRVNSRQGAMPLSRWHIAQVRKPGKNNRCRFEFDAALELRKPAFMLALPIEKGMLDPRTWAGLREHLGHHPIPANFAREAVEEVQADCLAKAVLDLLADARSSEAAGASSDMDDDGASSA